MKKEGVKDRDKYGKHINKKIDVSFDDVELLRLQGLIRCNYCKNPCPLEAVKCPTCGDKA
tara:strand:- start:922 stop:1101 length:180 start_codon:yes stop_codon:yes gene_type:complete